MPDRKTLDELLTEDTAARATKIPTRFNVTRYAIKLYRNHGTHGTPEYATMAEARAAARKDNQTFKPGTAAKFKTQAVSVDLTSRVIQWAEDIAYAARNPDVDVARTQKSILELIQFVQRGY